VAIRLPRHTCECLLCSSVNMAKPACQIKSNNVAAGCMTIVSRFRGSVDSSKQHAIYTYTGVSLFANVFNYRSSVYLTACLPSLLYSFSESRVCSITWYFSE
jgi:hypothetical protein